MDDLRFQTALARFLTDPAVRDAVLAPKDGQRRDGTVGPAGDLGLPTEDSAGLRLLDPERTAVFSELLILNRLSKVREGLPWTTALLGSEQWATVWEFNRACPPTDPKKFREAIAFAHFLTKRFSRRPAQPAFLADVLAYESTVLELRFQTHPPIPRGSPAPDGRTHLGPGQDGLQLTSVPYLLPGNRVVALEYDVEAIGQAIGRGEPPASAPRRPTCILMRLDASGVIHQDEINLPTLLFIESCDGATTLEAISADLAVQLGQDGTSPGFQRQCLELGSALLDRGVLGVSLG